MSFCPKRYRTYTNQKKTGEDPSKGSGLYEGYSTIAVRYVGMKMPQSKKSEAEQVTVVGVPSEL